MDYSTLIHRSSASNPFTPEELLIQFQNYVNYTNNEGLLWVYERVKYKNESRLEPTPKRVPLTIKNFCVYAMIPEKKFRSYLDETSSDFSLYGAVASYIDNACTIDFVNGAAVGVYNGNIALSIARELGNEMEERKKLETRIRMEVQQELQAEITRNGEMQQLPQSNVIRHEVEFIDFAYDEVSAGIEQDVPSDLTQPLDVQALIAKAQEAEAARKAATKHNNTGESTTEDNVIEVEATEVAGSDVPPILVNSPKVGEYDNKENTSTRHHNMHEYNQRNNTEL